jgi:hypothetical protein
MSGTEPTRQSGRRTRTAKQASDNSPADKAIELETAMTDTEKSKAAPKEGAIQVSAPLALGERPIGQGGLEVVESYSEAGLRPIGASHLDIYGMILNNRPIMASHLKVLDTNALADHRPIFASDLVMRDDLTLPGGRPIMASDPDLLAAQLLPGGRPIASNDIDDAETLMGYLD